jgi:hypothetical protein
MQCNAMQCNAMQCNAMQVEADDSPTSPSATLQGMFALVGRTTDLVVRILPLSAPGLGSPLPRLHRDWAHPCHVCTGTGLTHCRGLVSRHTPATSALGLGSPTAAAWCLGTPRQEKCGMHWLLVSAAPVYRRRAAQFAVVPLPVTRH